MYISFSFYVITSISNITWIKINLNPCNSEYTQIQGLFQFTTFSNYQLLQKLQIGAVSESWVAPVIEVNFDEKIIFNCLNSL